jgi:hypothetical protein
MANKSDNYFVKVSKYQKEHPRASRDQAMKAVSKMCGTKKKSVGSKKKVGAKKAVGAKPKKRSITETKRITTVGSVKRRSAPTISTAIRISNRIDDLTNLLRNTTGTEAKNRVKRQINAEHDKLDNLSKRLKSA